MLGITRQAYYQHFKEENSRAIVDELILTEVHSIRKDHPVIGGRKLHYLLNEFLDEHKIKLGRDALFSLLAGNSLLVKKRKRKHITTWSKHWLKKWPNLIREMDITHVNQLWVSDITYWRLKTGFAYISLITDAYSRKIVGYHLSKTLDSIETQKALQMALQGLPKRHTGLTHHSDRGVQYCCDAYIKMLQHHHINISMTENGDPLENAMAERINGILKEEYLGDNPINSFKQAASKLNNSVNLYNRKRPHLSLGMKTPLQVHTKKALPQKLWKSYYKKSTKIVNVLQD